MNWNREETLSFYQRQLEEDFLPFWNRFLDQEYGGVYTCISNDGTTLLSTDKYVWSQGRYLFCLAKTAEEIQKGYLKGDAAFYLEQAVKTGRFLWEHAMLKKEEGVCAFLLTREGTRKETSPGKGYYTSAYVNLFVGIGMAQLAKASGDCVWLERAEELYLRTRAEVDTGCFPSDPFPTHRDFTIHGIYMVLANLLDVMADAAHTLHHPRAAEYDRLGVEVVELIFRKYFDQETGLIREFVPKVPGYEDTMLARHLCPGHEIEGMWFYLHIILRNELPLTDKVYRGIKAAFQKAWDREYGGLLRMADLENDVGPGGRSLDDPYEDLILNTWDSKLWWTHSETLYASLLAYAVSEDPEFLELYRMTYEYAFRTFPNPDRTVGEWIQICDRAGCPESKNVALPVKDPYHLTRAFLMIVELLAEMPEGK